MNYVKNNLKFLRKKEALTQEQLATKIAVKRAMIGAYEEGRAEPRLHTLQHLAAYFQDLSGSSSIPKADVSGAQLRILPVIVDGTDEKELGTLVPVKASAGYLSGYGDADYIGALPRFSMPFPELPQDRTYRVFQIRGESMLPIKPGAYVITEYLQDWKSIRNDECYVLITKDEGVVYKRVINNLHIGELLLKSDNSQFASYTVPVDRLVEVWRAVGYTSFELPAAGNNQDISQLMHMMSDLKNDMSKLKEN
jgi:DNA-binding XRE family transcriptional regulator